MIIVVWAVLGFLCWCKPYIHVHRVGRPYSNTVTLCRHYIYMYMYIPQPSNPTLALHQHINPVYVLHQHSSRCVGLTSTQ